MERMTKRENGHVYYPRCFEEPCGGMGCLTEDCGFKVEICERLAAYEDTGLEPDEVLPKDEADEIALKLMCLADLESLCSYTRLRELAEADKDGRIVVLPCKVGDTVYRLQYIEQTPGRFVVGVAEIKFALLWLEEFGETVFLTREEAEAALEAMKND
jgi:hypothetical protein